MQAHNTITAVGHVINPKKYVANTKNGPQDVISWSLAFNDPFNPKDNSKTTWVQCSVWGKGALTIEQYCCDTDAQGKLTAKPGAAIYVSGTLSVQKWTSRNGEAGQTVVINVDKWYLMNERQQDESNASQNGHNTQAPTPITRARQATQPARQPALSAIAQELADENYDSDAIPF